MLTLNSFENLKVHIRRLGLKSNYDMHYNRSQINRIDGEVIHEKSYRNDNVKNSQFKYLKDSTCLIKRKAKAWLRSRAYKGVMTLIIILL